MTAVTKSEIINIVLDWYKQKSEAEDLAKIRKLNKEAGKKLLDMIDRRNDGIATFWARGKGIYGIWFDNEAAYINVGRSAD